MSFRNVLKLLKPTLLFFTPFLKKKNCREKIQNVLVKKWYIVALVTTYTSESGKRLPSPEKIANRQKESEVFRYEFSEYLFSPEEVTE